MSVSCWSVCSEPEAACGIPHSSPGKETLLLPLCDRRDKTQMTHPSFHNWSIDGRAGRLNSGLTSKPRPLATHCLPPFFKAFFVLDEEGRVGRPFLNVYVPGLYIPSMNVDEVMGSRPDRTCPCPSSATDPPPVSVHSGKCTPNLQVGSHSRCVPALLGFKCCVWR